EHERIHLLRPVNRDTGCGRQPHRLHEGPPDPDDPVRLSRGPGQADARGRQPPEPPPQRITSGRADPERTGLRYARLAMAASLRTNSFALTVPRPELRS